MLRRHVFPFSFFSLLKSTTRNEEAKRRTIPPLTSLGIRDKSFMSCLSVLEPVVTSKCTCSHYFVLQSDLTVSKLFLYFFLLMALTLISKLTQTHELNFPSLTNKRRLNLNGGGYLQKELMVISFD